MCPVLQANTELRDISIELIGCFGVPEISFVQKSENWFRARWPEILRRYVTASPPVDRHMD
jgi:hypothetical protein